MTCGCGCGGAVACRMQTLDIWSLWGNKTDVRCIAKLQLQYVIERLVKEEGIEKRSVWYQETSCNLEAGIPELVRCLSALCIYNLGIGWEELADQDVPPSEPDVQTHLPASLTL